MQPARAEAGTVRLTIDTSDAAQRWRYRCPAGHTQWTPTNYHWWCAACASSHDPDHEPEFTELVDKKTGEVYERDQVVVEGYRAKSQ